ncbi:MAG: DUF167 family protein [Candidatus Micrarchaeota archaeon]|nr:DUF167 family protein [Candidatus Micrarchaeota archaeon]
MIIEVSVVPNSSGFRLGMHGSRYEVEVRSRPEKGRANTELVLGLEKLLGCRVRLLRGASGRRKLLEVDMHEDEFRRLAQSPGQ